MKYSKEMCKLYPLYSKKYLRFLKESEKKKSVLKVSKKKWNSDKFDKFKSSDKSRTNYKIK